MNDVIHEQKFPGTKDKPSFLLNFVHLPQLISYELSTLRPFKPFMIRKQSENETETCNKESQLAWTKKVIKKNISLKEVNMELISIAPYIQ